MASPQKNGIVSGTSAMSFVDIRFLIFLPVVTVLHFLLPARFRWLWLLVASYAFYMAWRPAYGLLLFAITLTDFIAGLGMAGTNDPFRRKLWLTLSLGGNLGILFVFKYFDFATTSLQSALHAIGSGATLPLLSLILPIGISFHVFQSLSYTIEVYLRRCEPTRHFGKFALYVSFFPQLVAGPIERPSHLLKQINEGRSFELSKARHGAKLMMWGFFKKLVIADNLAPAVSAVYAAPELFTGPSLIIATIFFAYQIYCDFSGYTDIARGIAKLFGYDLIMNFNRPYASQSLGEFWRRWHISLSSWFRDYVYIPLGGNRVSRMRRYGNIFITFLLSGLWHGASWTYVIWGGLNGGVLVFADTLGSIRERTAAFIFRGPFSRLLPVWRTLVTFALVCFIWIFFRAKDLATASYIVSHLGSGWNTFIHHISSLSGIQSDILMGTSLVSPAGIPIALISIIFLETIDYLRAHGTLPVILGRLPRPLRFFLYSAFLLFVLTFGQFATSVPFIYFQF